MQIGLSLALTQPRGLGSVALGISGTPVLTGQVGIAYTPWTATANLGTAPYFFTSSTLPPGVAVDINTGIVSGTPTIAGVYAGTITVTDSAGSPATADLAFTITIAASLPGLPAEPTRGYLTAS